MDATQEKPVAATLRRAEQIKNNKGVLSFFSF